MSRERVGLVVGVITLLATLLPLWAFIPAIALLSFLIAREVATALRVEGIAPTVPLVVVVHALFEPLTLPIIGALSLAYGYRHWRLESFSYAFLVLVYAGVFPAFLIDIKTFGLKYLLSLLLTVWAIDVSAYYVGRRFGRVPVFPKISPKKTLEGYVGALVISFPVFWLFSGWDFTLSLFTTLCILIFGALGDYFKSFIKRQLGIKDFSHTLGEHGGFTDRYDSLIFSAPAYLLILDRFMG